MKHIDKLFKEKLYNHEAEVPEGMWERIAPIAEEESGRAILWFWFAGLLALLLGGFGIYKMVSYQTNPNNPGTLVQQEETQETPSDLISVNSLTPTINTAEEKEEDINEDFEKAMNDIEIKKAGTIAPQIKSESENSNISNSTHTISKTNNNNEPSSIGNTVESISNIVGVPANLVITKSYINKEGSVIKQTNLTDESGNEGPVYDVIINSEAKDFNAGALLRIIEPLEDIPLPAFQKKLKKKTRISIL